MASTFFHGVGINEILVGGVPITVVPAAVIGLVGVAPTWAVSPTSPYQPPPPNTPTLIGTTQQASAFGPMLENYSIPYALNAIQQQAEAGVSSIGQVIVINVFDPNIHNVAQAPSSFVVQTYINGSYINVKRMGILGPGLNGYTGVSTVVVTGTSGTPTYNEGTDYTVDYVNGIIWIVAGGAMDTSGATHFNVGFSYCSTSAVHDIGIVGSVANGVYTGMQAFLMCRGMFGFTPRILIAPGYSTGLAGSWDNIVADGLQAITCVALL
jgi:uncharacterized protein